MRRIPPAGSMDAESFVRRAYLAVLRRPADPGGLEAYARALELGEIDPERLLQVFMESGEFDSSYGIARDPQFEGFLTTEIAETSRALLAHRPYAAPDIDAAAPGLVGLEYFETHRRRFVEMVNGLDFIHARLGAPLDILEIGTIFTTKIIRTLMPAARISTVDVVAAENVGIAGVYMINEIVERHYQFDLVRGDLDGGPLEPGREFSLVLLCEVIEHLLVNPRRLLAFLLRQLKRGGYLYLTTPNIFKGGHVRAFARRVNPLAVYPEDFGFEDAPMFHVREYAMGELLKFAREAGGEVAAFHFSDCWDDPETAAALPDHELANLVVLIRKP
jgi:SAM-dependent methyltransferase